MTYKIPQQYSDPTKYRQVDPDNHDPDVYEIETGNIIDSRNGEVIGHANAGQADYDGSRDDRLNGIGYGSNEAKHDGSVPTNDLTDKSDPTGQGRADLMTNYLDDKVSEFDKQIKDAKGALNDPKVTDAQKKELQAKIDELQKQRDLLYKNSRAIDGANTLDGRKNAIAAAQDSLKNGISASNDLKTWMTNNAPK